MPIYKKTGMATINATDSLPRGVFGARYTCIPLIGIQYYINVFIMSPFRGFVPGGFVRKETYVFALAIFVSDKGQVSKGAQLFEHLSHIPLTSI
jgi:hypothetical protein